MGVMNARYFVGIEPETRDKESLSMRCIGYPRHEKTRIRESLITLSRERSQEYGCRDIMVMGCAKNLEGGLV